MKAVIDLDTGTNLVVVDLPEDDQLCEDIVGSDAADREYGRVYGTRLGL